MHVTDQPDAGTTVVPESCRRWLRTIADHLIPASGPMPAASTAGVADGQLDLVLNARPDLTPRLLRAWSTTSADDPAAIVEKLRQADPDVYQAICLIVAGGYYTNSEVRDLLGYTGQQPRVVQIADDIEEDLLMRVVERGSRYRPDGATDLIE
ncbi:hypothetical protein [Rhodococcus rhodochrous]|uniref:hypothetical protein n=1 Tax=Rhodococcus rhodochrous TaxID=1829 RepID=UPI0006C8D2B4|nr:hypothetical protein [Rhodococcus rhodochrous]